MEIVVCSSSHPHSKVIQQVSKASSDQLLSKFAEIDSDNETASSSKRRRSMRRSMKKKKKLVAVNNNVDEHSNNGSMRMVERKSLLPQHYCREKSSNINSKRCSRGGLLLFKQFGVSRSANYYVRGAKNFRTKSLLSAIDKTWTKAIRGASKVFMEKHYNRHRILIDDIV